jgi:hypothetical protein
MDEIIAKAPRGTWGRLVRYRDKWYGVAACWSDAQSHVWVLKGTGEWQWTCSKVLGFGHSPAWALHHVLREEGIPRRWGRWFST